MSRSTAEHRKAAPLSVRCAVVTVSDTRTAATDRGGDLVVEMLVGAGHVVVERRIVPDDPDALRELVDSFIGEENTAVAAKGGADGEVAVEAVLLTGGTGIAGRDRTYEAIRGLLTKEIPGYGELFRMLSYEEIGPAAMLSRAIGGVAGRTIVLTMPGSPAAVRLAMEKLILPELGHLVYEAGKEG